MSKKINFIRLSVITIAALMMILGAPAAVFHGVQAGPFASEAVYATDDHQIGAAGSNVTWELVDVSGGKKLVISGTGDIDGSLFGSDKAPWKNDRDSIVEVVVQDGITSIPKYFLNRMTALSDIYFSKDIKNLPSYSIYFCKSSLTELRFTEGLETIQSDAVYLCNGLTKIVFPNSLKSISQSAFLNTGNSYVSGAGSFAGTYYGYSSNEAVATFIAAVKGKFCDIRCENGHDFLVSCDEDGYHTVCTVCDKTAEMTTDKVINDITVPDTTYNGSAATPAVTVHYNGKYNVLDSSYYDVAYEDNDMTGTGYAVVTFKNGFSGTIRVPFVIRPGKPTKVVCKEITGGFRVSWTAPENNADNYVISYWNVFDGTKTKTVSGDECSADIFGKYTGQLCSVKVIAYKTIEGTEYSAESEEVESCFGGKAVAGPNDVRLASKKTVTVGFKTPISLTYDTFDFKLDKSKIKWSSSNKKIATIDSNGVVKAKKKGKCKIYCTYAGKKMTMALTVASNVYKGTKLSQLDPYSSYQQYVEIYPNKLSYNKKGQLVMKVALVNRRMFKANKFKWITITVKDKKGNVIAKQKFKNVKINCKRYGKKYITFTFTKGTKKKKFDLRNQFDYIDYDYYYTFTY